MDSNINMPLETDVECTYETIKEVSRTHLKSDKKRMMQLYRLDALIIFLSLLLLMIGGDKKFAITFLIIGVIWLPIFFLIRSSLIKKAYKTNIALQDATIHYTFYDENFEISTPSTLSKMNYEAIYSTIEDDKYILLLPSSKQYFAIDKRKCSEELINFLHQKMEEIKARNSKR